MNSSVQTNVIRILVLVLIQGLVLQRVQLGGATFNYLSVLFYPVTILLLPMNIGRVTLILVAFIIGLATDVFYGSFGVHAGACVLTAFLRPFTMHLLEPRGGYPVLKNPRVHDLGLNWFLRYSAIMMLFHLLGYFSLEVFSFAQIGQILIKTSVGFAVSYLAIVSYVLIFNPRM